MYDYYEYAKNRAASHIFVTTHAQYLVEKNTFEALQRLDLIFKFSSVFNASLIPLEKKKLL